MDSVHTRKYRVNKPIKEIALATYKTAHARGREYVRSRGRSNSSLDRTDCANQNRTEKIRRSIQGLRSDSHTGVRESIAGVRKRKNTIVEFIFMFQFFFRGIHRQQ